MRMTSRAADQIKKILDEERVMIAAESFVPAIGWLFNRTGNENDPGPTLCFFESSRVVEMKLYENVDFIIYDSLPEEMTDFFSDCELDLIAGNFNFVRNGVIVRAETR